MTTEEHKTTTDTMTNKSLRLDIQLSLESSRATLNRPVGWMVSRSIGWPFAWCGLNFLLHDLLMVASAGIV